MLPSTTSRISGENNFEEYVFERLEETVDAMYRLDANGIIQRRIPFKEDRVGQDYSHKQGVKYVIENHKLYVSEVLITTSGLSIEQVNAEMQVIVADDGIGFEVSNVISTSVGLKAGFGLFSIRDRMEQFGGRMEIDSDRGRGTRVVLVVPAAADEKNC